MKPESLFFSSLVRKAAGLILTDTVDVLFLRSASSVGKVVQTLLPFGNGWPDMASKTELFPDDWAPQTIICGIGSSMSPMMAD